MGLLSITTMSPRFSVGTSSSSTKNSIVSPSIGPGTLRPVRMPSSPIAPIVERLLPRSPGTASWTRWPGAARPYNRVSPKLLPISSIKMYLLTSNAPVSLRNLVRAFSSRSLAARLFFSRQLQLLQGAANGRHAHLRSPLLSEHGLAFDQRHIRVPGDGVPQQRPIKVAQLRGRAPALPRRQVFPRTVEAQHLFDKRHSHVKDPCDFANRHVPLLDGCHHSGAEFCRIWCHDPYPTRGRMALKTAIRSPYAVSALSSGVVSSSTLRLPSQIFITSFSWPWDGRTAICIDSLSTV